MTRCLGLAALATLALIVLAAPASAAGITGHYVEARNCDVWTGPCFANAEMNLGGKNAVLGWKIDKGTLNNVKLDGLGVVAVIAASDTLGLEQTGPAKAVLIVDQRATKAEREALIQFAQAQGGALLRNVISVETSAINLDICPCKNDGCAVLKAGIAKIETRCLGEHDTICGNESPYYPPLVKNVKVKAALSVENCYTGSALNQTWKESGRRSAYLGSFEVR